MEEQELAKLLYDSVLALKKQGNGESEEGKRWASFREKLNRELDVSGCGAKAETYTDFRPYGQACGYHGDYGYFFVSCGDRGAYSIEILEEEEETAVNRFLAWIIDRRAYEWALEMKDRGEVSWPYHCRYDYRRLWFGKALEWLAPVVDWSFFAQCADRYVGLLNRWFALPHWEYDYQFGRIIEIGESKEYSDEQYVYHIEYDAVEDCSGISLIGQCNPNGSGSHEFQINGMALDMRRKGAEVWILMDRAENNADAYSLNGEFLRNIGDETGAGRHYDDIDEAELDFLR